MLWGASLSITSWAEGLIKELLMPGLAVVCGLPRKGVSPAAKPAHPQSHSFHKQQCTSGARLGTGWPGPPFPHQAVTCHLAPAPSAPQGPTPPCCGPRCLVHGWRPVGACRLCQ